jgi:hypothetical protein
MRANAESLLPIEYFMKNGTDNSGLLRCLTFIYVRGESSACAARSSGSARRSRTFSGPHSGEGHKELLARIQSKVDALYEEPQRKERRIKYPGTNKAISGPIERRFR